MAENEKFYRISDYSDKVIPGDKIHIEHSIYAQRNSAEISQLTALPLDKLQTMREESAAAEQTIFDKLREAAREWEEQAAQTLQLDMAIEYAKVPPVKHTSNQWEKDEYDNHSISNMVYRMDYRISTDTYYDRETKKSVPTAWHISWDVRTNCPNRRSNAKIAGQSRKRYTDKADMEKYLAGRIKAHSHLFTEISPPIPNQYTDYFKVNGQLLPGYSIEGEEPKATNRAEQTQKPEQQQPDPAADIDGDFISTKNE